MKNIILKSSDSWQKEFPNVKILDPDGWDRKNFQYSWFEELISYDEYIRRTVRSTVRSTILG